MRRTILPSLLNGRQNRLARKDFLAFAATLQFSSTFAEQRIAHILDLQPEFARQIAASAFGAERRARLVDMVGSRLKRPVTADTALQEEDMEKG